MASVTTDQIYGVETSKAVKVPCRVATTANITLSGEQTINGVAVAAGDRVLVKNQSSGVDNGIWVAAAGAWSRAEDYNGPRDVTSGTQVLVNEGTLNADTVWTLTTVDPIVIGTTALTFTNLSNSAVGLPASITALSYLRGNAGGTAYEARTPAQVRSDLSLGALALLATVATAQIDDAAVTYAKIQDVTAASRLLGRGSAGGAGDVEELTVGAGLSISGTALSATIAAANPTGTVGLSAVNGAAATFMRSDGAPALSQAIAPTWTALHTFTANAGGIFLTGTPGLTVALADNPYFIEDSKTSMHIKWQGASANSPEAGLQITGTNNLGFGDSTSFKVGLFSSMLTASGAGASYAANFVLDIGSGTGEISGIACEANLNVRNQHYGDTAGAPTGDVVAPFYTATGGDKRATAAILINCDNVAASDQPFNRGICFYGGDIRLNVYEDYTASSGGIMIAGSKVNCIDTRLATVSGKQIIGTGFDFDPSGNLTAANLTKGSYTPTLTGVANLAASTAYTTYYERRDDRIHVWGRFDLDPTLAGPTQTTVGISLPVASNLGVAEDLGGTAVAHHTQQAGGIWGDAANNRAELNYIATNTGNASFSFEFSYRVI